MLILKLKGLRELDATKSATAFKSFLREAKVLSRILGKTSTIIFKFERLKKQLIHLRFLAIRLLQPV